MTKGLKTFLGLSAMLGIGYGIYRAGQSVTKGITYAIKGFGIPSFSGTVVTLPINIVFTNSSNIPVPIDKLKISLSYKQKNEYIAAGELNHGSFTLEKGDTPAKFQPKIDLKALFKNVLTTLDTIVDDQAVTVKAIVTVTVLGQAITQTVYQNIPVKA